MKKKVVYLSIAVSLLLLTTLTFGYAYFSSALSGEGKEQIVETGTLQIKFTDGVEVIGNDLVPGDKIEKTFTVENTGTLDATFKVNLIELINTIEKDELVYTISDGTNEYSGVVDYSEDEMSLELYNGLKINVGETKEYTITFTFKEINAEQNYNQGKNFKGKLQIENGCVTDIKISLLLNGAEITSLPENGYYKLVNYTCENGSNVVWNSLERKVATYTNATSDTCTLEFSEADSLAVRIVEDNEVIDDTTSLFSGTSGTGLYKTTNLARTEDVDGDGTGEVVYYYRGAVTNNYLIFADYCWRIVRTNEDGSVKLRYNGAPIVDGDNKSCSKTGTNVSIGTGAMAVNYGSSAAKSTIDTWYANNIASKGTSVTSLIADVPYCNDQSYAAKTRLTSSYAPQYKCPQESYKFSVENGKLTHPVALITGDEVSYAGGKYNTANSSYYLYTTANYWTMTPYSASSAFNVYGSGNLHSSSLSGTYALLPAVSLNAKATVASGTGVFDDPYIIG